MLKHAPNSSVLMPAEQILDRPWRVLVKISLLRSKQNDAGDAMIVSDHAYEKRHRQDHCANIDICAAVNCQL